MHVCVYECMFMPGQEIHVSKIRRKVPSRKNERKVAALDAAPASASPFSFFGLAVLYMYTYTCICTKES